MFAEDVTNRGGGAVAVIGHNSDQDRNTFWRVPLIGDLLVGDALHFARGAFDHPLDVLFRQVRCPRPLQRLCQARVVSRVGIAVPCLEGDLLDQLGKQAGPFLILTLFPILDILPLRVS